MGATAEETIKVLEDMKKGINPWYPEEYCDTAISTMLKYQKVVDIYYHQSGRALEDSLRSVIEDGRID